jgi:hypothetical protein
MPDTAIRPFREDIARAKELARHARGLPETNPPERLLRDDILRAAWMFAVGAMDAYFCDAYADLIAATLMAKSHEPTKVLPPFVEKIEIPVAAVLADYSHRQNWKWRMAARQMMADQNSLRIKTIKEWFNPFFVRGKKLFYDMVPLWIVKSTATARVFGMDPASFTASKQNIANDALESRFQTIVQRRHDCIHTCDRPSNSPQVINSAGTVDNVIRDIEFIVVHSNLHIDAEFKAWLIAARFSVATVARVGY